MKNTPIKFHLLLLSYIFFSLIGCERPPGADVKYSIRFYNNSKLKLNLFMSYLYPDTLMPTQRPYLYYVGTNSDIFIDSSVKWDKVFYQLPQDTLALYLINSDSLEKYGWETIATKQKIVVRIDLSYNDLEQNSFIVNYP
jgi:hypothetical protein